MYRSFITRVLSTALLVFLIPLALSEFLRGRFSEFEAADIAAIQAKSPDALYLSGLDQDVSGYKLELTKLRRPDIVVIGSSRAMQVRSEFLNGTLVNWGGVARTIGQLHWAAQEIVEPDAMLGRKRDRLAESELEGIVETLLGRPALALVGADDHPRGALAQQFGQDPVHGRDADAGVDHEEADVGQANRALGKGAHPTREAVVGHLLEASGVDHGEAQRAEAAGAFAKVARHARLIIDKRQSPPDQTVEQRRFSDIGAADEGKRERHGQTGAPRHRLATRRDP